MLQPKRQKFRKHFRGGMKGVSTQGDLVNFGEYGLKLLECGWISAQQIEAARRAVVHYTNRAGKLWLRIFPDKPITSKAQGVTMGSGKGDVSGYVAVVKPGRIMFEIAGVSETVAREALRRAAHKLPVASKIVTRETLSV